MWPDYMGQGDTIRLDHGPARLGRALSIGSGAQNTGAGRTGIRKKRGKAMEYKFTATLKQDLEITIQADSYEEALRIADYETISDDWNVVGAEFNLEAVK
jgi:hypothetical protein